MPSSAATDNTTAATPMLEDWTALTQQAATFLDPKAHVEGFYQAQTRPDGRLFAQARPTTVQPTLLSKHAAGSAQVSLGDTNVVASVTLQVGQPTTSPECPAGQGDVLVASVQASAGTTAGTSGNQQNLNISILQSFLQRILDVMVDKAVDSDNTGNGMDSMHPLVLIPGSQAVRLVVSIQILQDAGNLIDACLLASVAALLDAKLPRAVQDGAWVLKPSASPNESSANHPEESYKRLKFPILPIPLTMGLYLPKSQNDDKNCRWMVDPTNQEEGCLETMLTVVVNGNSSSQQEEILCLDSSGASFSTTHLALAVKMAAGRAQEVCPLLVSSSLATSTK